MSGHLTLYIFLIGFIRKTNFYKKPMNNGSSVPPPVPPPPPLEEELDILELELLLELEDLPDFFPLFDFPPATIELVTILLI